MPEGAEPRPSGRAGHRWCRSSPAPQSRPLPEGTFCRLPPSPSTPAVGPRSRHNELPEQMVVPSPRSRPACLSHENGGRRPDRCPPSHPGQAVGTRGHVLTRCLERPLDSLCWALLLPTASLPQPCPSSTQKNDTCFPLLHPCLSEATGWDCPEGWTVQGLVSVHRGPHFEQGPHPNTVQSRAHAILLPFTYPSLKTVQEALLFLLPEHSSPDVSPLTSFGCLFNWHHPGPSLSTLPKTA